MSALLPLPLNKITKYLFLSTNSNTISVLHPNFRQIAHQLPMAQTS